MHNFEDVYETLLGERLPEYAVPGVENIYETGSACDKAYTRIYQAYGHLCQRLGVADEDPDVEIIINSLLEIQNEVARKMFSLGKKLGWSAPFQNQNSC